MQSPTVRTFPAECPGQNVCWRDHLLFKRAAELRRQLTGAEELLWSYLRTKPLGFKFRRQHPFLHYILDFYCHHLHLAIEMDGPIHNDEAVKENDQIRQKHLEARGLCVMRFTNNEVEQSLEKVTRTIEQFLLLKNKPNDERIHRPKSPL